MKTEHAEILKKTAENGQAGVCQEKQEKIREERTKDEDRTGKHRNH